jgi:hypothetical protein
VAEFDGTTGRLQEAFRKSKKAMEVYRRNCEKFVKQYVGLHYSNEGTETRVPINMIELLVNTHTRQLSSRRPRVMVTTDDDGLANEADKLKKGLNQLIAEMRLEKVLRRTVKDSLFMMGIVKIGVANDQLHPSGEFFMVKPFVESVHLDDFVWDMQTRRPGACQFMANRYHVPLAKAKENPAFDENVRGNLLPNEERLEGTAKIGGDVRPGDEYIEQTSLWDVWLPEENVIETYPDEVEGKPLERKPWTSAPGGPFRVLVLEEVPNSLMPLSPVATLYDLHRAANMAFNKSINQIERRKHFLGISVGSPEDADRITQVPDGHAAKLDSPDGAKEHSLGQFDADIHAFAMQTRELASIQGGNLDALAGLGPQSPTASQDKMLLSSASQRVSDYQEAVIEFTTDILKTLAWYEWNDPALNRQFKHTFGGTGVSTRMSLTADTRQARLSEYEIKIEPYSMQRQTPGSRYQALMETWQNVIMPAQQMLGQQGVTADVRRLMRLVAEYRDMPELEELLIFSGELVSPPGPETGGRNNQSHPGPRQPSVREAVMAAGAV